jgi:hypothetical protein
VFRGKSPESCGSSFAEYTRIPMLPSIILLLLTLLVATDGIASND